MGNVARVGASLVVMSVAIGAQDESPPKTLVTFADAQPLLDRPRQDLPPQLAGTSGGEPESAWRQWVRAHDVRIRGRLARGDEDSLVNLWLFGTSFTELPPARPRDVAMRGGGAPLSQVADGRLRDLFEALASPGANERLQWASQVLRAKGHDPASPSGQAGARALLSDLWKRAVSENADYGRVLSAANTNTDPLVWMAAYANLFRDRGLSSDTSILSSFTVDTALEALKTSGLIGAGSIRRVAVVGPGLDFVDKADGHDFYPVQTIQPFAVIDSLIHHGLSRPGDVTVTTFDVSARVNQHLVAARDRARAGDGYVVQLPLSDAERWSPALVRYWERIGGRVGTVARASRPPRSTGNVKVRAVRIRPDVALAVTPRDLNIVLERLEPLRDDETFDLVVATNVFIYYDKFEQALAVTNVGRMLRSGGSLLSNQAVLPVAPMKQAVGHETVAFSDRQFDRVFWYQRQ